MFAHGFLDDVPQYRIVSATKHERVRFELTNLTKIFLGDGKRFGFGCPTFLCEWNEERTRGLKDRCGIRRASDSVCVCIARNRRLGSDDRDTRLRFVLRFRDGLSTARSDDADDIEADTLADLRQRER